MYVLLQGHEAWQLLKEWATGNKSVKPAET
jgi:hypothetical protein